RYVRARVWLNAVLRGATGLGHDRTEHLRAIPVLEVDLVDGPALDFEPRERHVVGQDVDRGRGGAARVDDPGAAAPRDHAQRPVDEDRKSTRLNSSHVSISYAV